jgi:hypothetical protein
MQDKPLQVEFHNWKHNEITKRLFLLLKDERERMKEGLVYNQFDEAEEVKGRCRAIQNLLDITFEDLYESVGN